MKLTPWITCTGIPASAAAARISHVVASPICRIAGNRVDDALRSAAQRDNLARDLSIDVGEAVRAGIDGVEAVNSQMRWQRSYDRMLVGAQIDFGGGRQGIPGSARQQVRVARTETDNGDVWQWKTSQESYVEFAAERCGS